MMNFLFLTSAVFTTFAGVASAPHVISNDAKSEDKNSKRYPDGHILNGDQQCQLANFVRACDPEPQTCKTLQCVAAIYGSLQCKSLPRRALSGTACGPNKAECFEGECRIGDYITVEKVER